MSPATMFRGQDIHTDDAGLQGPDFAEIPFAGRRRLHCPETPVAVVRGIGGADAAVMVGVAVDAGGALVEDRSFPFRREDENFWPRIEEFVVGLGGR